MPRQPAAVNFWIVMGCINLTIPVVIAFQAHNGDLNSTTALISYWISVVLLNAVFLLAMRRRSASIATKNRLLMSIGFAALLGLASTIYLVRFAPRNVYYYLAMSNRPLDSIHPERKRLIVGFIRERAANSKQYAAEAAHFPPLNPPLYSSESFASVDAINRTVDRFGKAVALDEAYSDRLKSSKASFKQQMSKVDPLYLKSWLSSPGDNDDGEASAFALEQQWSLSVQALYKYAAENHKKITDQKGQLVFASAEVKSQFDKLESVSVNLAKKMHATRASLAKKQLQAKAAM